MIRSKTLYVKVSEPSNRMTGFIILELKLRRIFSPSNIKPKVIAHALINKKENSRKPKMYPPLLCEPSL